MTINNHINPEVNTNHQSFDFLPINKMNPNSSTTSTATWCEDPSLFNSYQELDTVQTQPSKQPLPKIDPTMPKMPNIFETLESMLATSGSLTTQAYEPVQGLSNIDPALNLSNIDPAMLDSHCSFQPLQMLPSTLDDYAFMAPATTEVLPGTAMEGIQALSYDPLPAYAPVVQGNTLWDSDSLGEQVHYTFTPTASFAQNVDKVPQAISSPCKTDSNNESIFMRSDGSAEPSPPSSPEDCTPSTVIPTFTHTFDIITQEDAAAIVRRALDENRPIFHESPKDGTLFSKIVVSGHVYVAELGSGKRWIDQGNWTGSRKACGKDPAMIYRQRKANTRRGKTFSNAVTIDEHNCKQLMGLSTQEIYIQTGMSLLEFTNRYIAGPRGCDMADPHGMVKRSFKVNIPSDDPLKPGDRSFMVFSYYKLKDLQNFDWHYE